MKVIKNQVEGGKVAFEILKEKIIVSAQTLGLRQEQSMSFTRIVESDLDFQI